MLVTYQPHTLGHSNAQRLWEKLPHNRQSGSNIDADVILYDEIHRITEGLAEEPKKLHVLVVLRGFNLTHETKRLPDEVILIYPDQSAALLLLMALMEIRHDRDS